MNAESSLDSGGLIGPFLRAHFFVEKDILFACTPRQMSFLTISRENIFRKNSGGHWRLGAVVAPYEDLQ